MENCRSLFLVNSLSLRQMPGLTFGGLAASQFAGLSCLSRRSLRFFSLSLQRNILFTSLASCSLLRLSPTVSFLRRLGDLVTWPWANHESNSFASIDRFESGGNRSRQAFGQYSVANCSQEVDTPSEPGPPLSLKPKLNK